MGWFDWLKSSSAKSISPLSPMGGSSNGPVAGFLPSLDPARDCQGPEWYGGPGKLGTARKMVLDPHVRQSLAARISPLRAAFWDFEPESDSPLDLEVADYCRLALLQDQPWDKVLQGILKFHRDGFSLVEVTERIAPVSATRFPNHPNPSAALLFGHWYVREPSTIQRWEQSKLESTQIAGVEQYIIGSDGEPTGSRYISAERLLRFTQEQEGANFSGFATTRSANQPWKIKLNLLVIDAIKHERSGSGTPAVSLPPGADDDDVAEAERILASLRSHEKGFIILPDGYEFEWKQSGQNTELAIAIERCNRDIAFNVGAGFMLLGLTGSGPGSYAMSQTQQGQYEVSLEGDAKFVCGVINLGSDGYRPIERLVRENYGPNVAVPKLVVRNMPTRDWSKVLEKLPVLADKGLLQADATLRKFIRNVQYLPNEEVLQAVTQTALNGAQIQAVQTLLISGGKGELPRDTLVESIAGMLALPVETVDRWVGSIGKGFVAPTSEVK